MTSRRVDLSSSEKFEILMLSRNSVVILRIKKIFRQKPLCGRNLAAWLTARDATSLSDSDPSVSYSVMGMWSVRIFLTSESVEPGLSDSIKFVDAWWTNDAVVVSLLIGSWVYLVWNADSGEIRNVRWDTKVSHTHNYRIYLLWFDMFCECK